MIYDAFTIFYRFSCLLIFHDYVEIKTTWYRRDSWSAGMLGCCQVDVWQVMLKEWTLEYLFHHICRCSRDQAWHPVDLGHGLGHGLFEREMGKSGVFQGSGISGFLQLDVEIWGVVSEPGVVKTPTWTLLLKLEAKEWHHASFQVSQKMLAWGWLQPALGKWSPTGADFVLVPTPLNTYITGWWFGTCFSHILGIIIPTDELIFFRGVGIPPTRLLTIINHH